MPRVNRINVDGVTCRGCNRVWPIFVKAFTTEGTEEHRGTLGAQIFVWFGAVALDEVVRSRALFAFELKFEEFE